MTPVERAFALATRTAARWAVPGGVIAVSDASGLVAQQAFGVADVETGVGCRTDHLFEIGSISKVATAIAVLQLVDDGRIRLDQPVSELLPWVPSAFAEERRTVRHLLSHTGGLVASIDAVPDETGQLAGFAGSSGDPGASFHYSNVGFLLLGRIVASVTREPFEKRIAQEVLARAGMSDAVAAVTHDTRPRMALGSQRLYDDRPWLPGDPLVRAPWLEVAGADGNIAATAADLARFGRLLLNGGTADDGIRLLSEATFALMTSPVAPTGEEVVALRGIPSPDSSRYGLGINVESGPWGPMLTHGGGMVGYASFLLVDVDAAHVVAVVTNADGDSPIAEAMARVADAALRDADDLATPDPAVWDGVSSPGTEGGLGLFTSADGSATIDVRSTIDGREVTVDGTSAPLEWTWSGRAVTRHPALRPHPLTFAGERWTWGPHVLRSTGAQPPVLPSAAGGEELCGHYRTYSPWFTNFRIVDREGVLTLIATGGVEAPAEDMPLVAIGERRFRIGADPALPETIVFGASVDGRAAWAERSGCRYSRSFTP